VICAMTLYGIVVTVGEVFRQEELADSRSWDDTEETDPEPVGHAQKTIVQLEALAEVNQREAIAEKKRLEKLAEAKRKEFENKLHNLAAPKQAKAAKLGHEPLLEFANRVKSTGDGKLSNPRLLKAVGADLGVFALGDINAPEENLKNRQALRTFSTLRRFDSRMSAWQFGFQWCVPIEPATKERWQQLRSHLYWENELTKLLGHPRREQSFPIPRTKDKYEITVRVMEDLAALHELLVDRPAPPKAEDVNTIRRLIEGEPLSGTIDSGAKHHKEYRARLVFQTQKEDRFEGELELKGTWQVAKHWTKPIDGVMHVEGAVRGDSIAFRTIRFIKSDKQLFLGAIYRGKIRGRDVTGRWEFPITKIGAEFELH